MRHNQRHPHPNNFLFLLMSAMALMPLGCDVSLPPDAAGGESKPEITGDPEITGYDTASTVAGETVAPTGLTTLSGEDSLSSSDTAATSEAGSGESSGGPFCGNGVAEGDEACDGDDMGGHTCESFGLAGGQMTCYDDCNLNRSDCHSIECGEDGTADGEVCPEECDECHFGGGISTCQIWPDSGEEVTCPDDFQCQVACFSPFGCNDTTINCADEQTCYIGCYDGACDGAEFNCGDHSTCDIDCIGAEYDYPSCHNATANCGGGSCNIDCEAEQVYTGFDDYFFRYGPAEINDCENACGCSLTSDCPG